MRIFLICVILFALASPVNATENCGTPLAEPDCPEKLALTPSGGGAGGGGKQEAGQVCVYNDQTQQFEIRQHFGDTLKQGEQWPLREDVCAQPTEVVRASVSTPSPTSTRTPTPLPATPTQVPPTSTAVPTTSTPTVTPTSTPIGDEIPIVPVQLPW